MFWQSLFGKVHADYMILFVFMACLTLVGLVAIVVATWTNVVRIREDAELKQSMLNRGMSAEEIERILKAKSHGKS